MIGIAAEKRGFMIRLNDRLKTMAARIDRGETMADIGTDHGFLPVYLLEKEVSPKVIMADISEPSLDKARKNFNMNVDMGRLGSGDFRVGDGLSVLEPSEVDVVVIAGMGGRLIADIMAEDIELTASFDKFILQPRIGQGYLRKWLLDNGFEIIYEDLVREGKYIAEVITAVSPNCASAGESGFEGMAGSKTEQQEMISESADGSEMICRIPPWIVNASGPVEEFLLRNIEAEKTKLENVKLSKKRNRELEENICGGMRYLEDLLVKYQGKELKIERK